MVLGNIRTQQSEALGDGGRQRRGPRSTKRNLCLQKERSDTRLQNQAQETLDTGQVLFCRSPPVRLGDGAHFYRQKAPNWRCKHTCQGSQLVNRGLRSPLPSWAVWLPGATLPTTRLYCSRGPPGSAHHAHGLASSEQRAVCFPG